MKHFGECVNAEPDPKTSQRKCALSATTICIFARSTHCAFPLFFATSSCSDALLIDTASRKSIVLNWQNEEQRHVWIMLNCFPHFASQGSILMSTVNFLFNRGHVSCGPPLIAGICVHLASFLRSRYLTLVVLRSGWSRGLSSRAQTSLSNAHWQKCIIVPSTD